MSSAHGETDPVSELATRLGIGTMTLYGYVADRDALIAYMINEVVVEIAAPGQPSGSWRADLERVARAST
jgi:AcrR family transcriptional regulator